MHPCMETWDDLRILLAVHRSGTLSAAARELGVNQSTVSRRVARLTKVFSATLLEARSGRYALTSAGLLALQRAEVVESEIHSLERQLDRLDDRPEGTVRLSTPDGLGSVVLAPRLTAFREEHPGIELLLAAESPVVNLVQREADVAVRVTRSTQRELLVRRIARIGFLPWATGEYLSRRDGRRALREDDDLVVHDSPGDSPETRWLLSHVPRGGCDSSPRRHWASRRQSPAEWGWGCCRSISVGERGSSRSAPGRWSTGTSSWSSTGRCRASGGSARCAPSWSRRWPQCEGRRWRRTRAPTDRPGPRGVDGPTQPEGVPRGPSAG